MKVKVPNNDLPRLYREVLEEIRDACECVCEGKGASDCPTCLADTVLDGYDPWGRDHSNNQWDIDEMAPGEYLAYISGFTDDGFAHLELFETNVSIEGIKNDVVEGIMVRSKCMPAWQGHTLSACPIIRIEILPQGGYTVLDHLGSRFS
ncbi:MAG: hypothetical protein R3330_13885 [Saprospiraceae bacterium]|nr:hypothetical protein [Saprospiraceae bacterium]